MQFMSLNAHSGHSQSRRDDLESLIYLTIFMLTNKVPWKYQPIGRANSANILEAKQKMNLYEIAADCPSYLLIRRNRRITQVC